MKVQIEEAQQRSAPQPQTESRRGSLLGWFLSVLLVVILVARFLPEALMLWGVWTPPALVEATAQPAQQTARPVVTVRAIPVQQQQTQATTAPVQAAPAAPAPAEAVPAAPVIEEYVPPPAPILQPTPAADYTQTISDYSDRSPCSMPRANPATCGQGVPEIPWPEGRNP